jgi:hypothetical protein
MALESAEISGAENIGINVELFFWSIAIIIEVHWHLPTPYEPKCAGALAKSEI